ncbi:MAG: protein kinase [Anaerolineae bacterium]|nr:protein kinase [Thermoflexales bacterium]MDW8407522.1 protein kinase [Anaerolineae bacterium]
MSSQPSNTSSPGLALLNGRYRLLAVVAGGGMATVYKAQDILLGRLVAVKTLRDRLAQDPQFVQRFRDEAQAAANLNHPNIVTVFDVGRDMADGIERHYIVMEYVEGHDLKHLIRERTATLPAGQAFGIEEAVDIARQICEGVGYAHRRGLVHCDLKPQNVLITPERRAKVTDFGIARAYTAMIAERADVVWGTPQYYAPEQATGAPPTPASDVYSIGIILYEMLSGRLPFDARDSQELARLHLSAEPPALHLLNPNVTLQLEAIVRRALAKDPAQRYRDADQFARVLTAYLAQGEEQTLGQQTQFNLPQPSSRSQASAPYISRPGPPRDQPAASASRSQPRIAQPPGASQTGRSRGYSMTIAPAASDSQAASVPEGRSASEGGTDLLVWLLGALAVLCVVGLIPLYVLVYRAYTTPVNRSASSPASGVVFTPTIILANQSIILPSFIGLSPDEAARGVRLLGMQPPLVESRPDPNVREPLVFDQRPPPGAQVTRDVTITLIVSAPAQTQIVPVDLVGRTLDDTLSQTLRQVGWNVVVSETIAFQPANLIVQSDPPGGSRLALGGTLTLTVSTGGRVPLNVDLSPIKLEWARFSRDQYIPGQTIQFSVSWRATASVARGYKVGWYLVSSAGEIVAQGEDREPRHNGTPVPTNLWRANTVVLDTYTLPIPAGLLPGSYQVGILLYDDQGRLPVLDPGQASLRSGIVMLYTIRVE